MLEMSPLKIMTVVSYFIRLTCLFSFILVEVTRSLQGLGATYTQAGKSVVVICLPEILNHCIAQQPASQ